MPVESETYFDRFRSALDQGERPSRVIVFADIFGSTEMKSKGEVTWLPTVGKFYDVVQTAVADHGGRIVKYLGDGAIAVFSDDSASDAINSGIVVQEELERLRKEGKLQCQCSVGIATGRPVEFSVDGNSDYLGATVDLASRLCGSASPNALWADANTISAANMARVRSNLGVALRRGPAEYRTGEESIRLKGFIEPIYYHEIIWSSTAFGVRNSVLTAIVKSDPARPQRESMTDDARAWSFGRVVSWNMAKNRGFIRSEGEDQDRYVIGYWLAATDHLLAGQSVAFHPRSAVTEGKNGTAVCVVPLDAPIQAQVSVLPTAKDYGFVEVKDTNRTVSRGLIFFSVDGREYAKDQWLTVTLSKDRNGKIRAFPILPVDN